MAFLNTNNSILIDSKGNIYNFSLIRSGIELIIHKKSTSDADKSIIINEAILEYDVSINEHDEIDLICKKKDKSLSIYSLSNNEWKESEISKEVDYDICGIKIVTVDKTRHIFYYMRSVQDSERLNIYHHYLKDRKWHTNIIKDIYLSEIIKPIEVIKHNNDLIIGYYDLGRFSEDIFISKFDMIKDNWSKPFNITDDRKLKLYLDILQVEDYIHITYSEYQEENLVIKHKKIKKDFSDVLISIEGEISNKANCTYPTLIYSMDLLWNVWTEYESVVSAYSKDNGETWSNPYVWSDSKKINFTRGKFITTQSDLKDNHIMNYCFIRTYPELSFLGFGDLTQAVESIKKKEEDEEEFKEETFNIGNLMIDTVELKEKESQNKQALIPAQELLIEFEPAKVEKNLKTSKSEILNKNEVLQQKRIDDLEKRLYHIKKEMINIKTKIDDTQFDRFDKRISNIENQIIRRRNPFTSRTQQKKDS